MKKEIGLTLMLTTAVLAAEQDNEELKQAFGQMVVYQEHQDDSERSTLHPTPPPTPPATPTTWAELATALNSPFYSFHGASCGQSSLMLVNRLQSIEAVGTDKATILDKQLEFIGTTWTTWDGVWESYPPHRRYRIIYNFILNRSQQTTKKGWLAWLGCFK